MAKKIIHVAQDAIRANTKDGGTRPAIIVRNGRKATRHNSIELTKDGQTIGRFVYQPHDPLSCGARLWLELAEGVDVRSA